MLRYIMYAIPIILILFLIHRYCTDLQTPSVARTDEILPKRLAVQNERTIPAKKLSWDIMGQNCRRRIRSWPTYTMRWLALARRRINKHDPSDPTSVWLSKSHIESIFPPKVPMWKKIMCMVPGIIASFFHPISPVVCLTILLPFGLYIIGAMVSSICLSTVEFMKQSLFPCRWPCSRNMTSKRKYGMTLLYVTMCLLLVGTANATRKVKHDEDPDFKASSSARSARCRAR